MSRFHPKDDGVTHINVYSQGKTELGRLLSNFADTPFKHPIHGPFRTVEGFWYWLMTGDEAFRYLNGGSAKRMGKSADYIRNHPTEEELETAYRAKLQAHPRLLELLRENQLPLTHYYVYGDKVVEAREWLWTAKLWEDLI